MKAFIFDPLWDELVTNDLLEQLKVANIEIVVTKEIAPLRQRKELFEGTDERILCLNPDYVSWKLSSDDYKDIPNLKAILIASTGFEWVESDVANERNIPVCQIKNFSTQAVAEWAITIMFNLARQTPRLIKDGFPLDYDKDFMKYRGMQLKGKTAGIIGLGHNGSAIAERCAGLGMNVVYWSHSSTNDVYKKVELDELTRIADVIFPTFAKNEATNKLLTSELLSSAKQSAIIVDIIELSEDIKTIILDRVRAGKLFGYGFEAKPATFDQYEGNVWATPAYGWTTYESMYNSVTLWVENMIEASKNNFPNRVN